MSPDDSDPAGPTLPRFGRYQAVRIIGRGAFATVYEAQDPALDATVAIKVLADNHSTDPDIRARFINEARVVRRIGTDRLVAVHDIGEERGQPYIVMELARGGTLASRIAAGASAHTPEAAQRIVAELGNALAAIHDRGVVHRDLKPSNVLIQDGTPPTDGSLLGPGERLVLGDFGLARDVDASTLTVAGGTDGYMAPEQRTPSASIDQRADLYAATAVIAELLAPAVATTAEMQSALAAGMSVDPAGRPADATAWSVALHRAVGATASPVAAPPSPAAGVASNPPTGSTRRWLRWAAPAVAVVLALVVAIVAFTGGGSEPDGPTIVGPDAITIGEATIYRADPIEGASYYWTDWQGVRHEGSALEVDPVGEGVLPITLTEVVDGGERSTDLVITVAEP